jgi:hypothetical protein
MRKQGNEDAWKFVLMTDVGKEHMDAIREQAAKLIQRDRRHEAAQGRWSSRCGCPASASPWWRWPRRCSPSTCTCARARG